MIDQNSQFFAILTAVGEAKQANATALGLSWTFAQMGVGDANDTDPIPNRAQTKLINEWRRAPVNQVRPDSANPNIIITEQVIPADVGGKWIRELALYDADGDMVAVANCAPSFKPLLVQGTGKTQVIRMNFIVASTANIVLKIDPAVVLATRSYVDSSIVNVLPGGRRAGSYTKVQINERGIVVDGLNPSTLEGYGITDAYTKSRADELLDQRVAADTIISAGFVSGDINKPYFRERKPDGGVGGIINLALAAHVHTFESLKDKPSTMQGYGITDAYTKVKANELLEQRVAADTIISAGFVSGDISKPYFLERKPDGGVGGIINLAPAAHVHTFESLKDKPSTMQGYGIADAYTKVKSDELLNQRVAADGIVAAGFVSGDLNYPYFLKSPNSIVHLARRTQVDAKPDGDWVDAVGLISNEPSLPYMHQKGGGNVLLVARSELPRNTCAKGIPGWWRCADTGLLRQRVSVYLGDVSTAWAGSVAFPVAFATQADSVKISVLQNTGSPATLSCSYSELTTSGCKLRVDEWSTAVQYGLTLIVEAEGY